jgi:uncharacterized membrane protein
MRELILLSVVAYAIYDRPPEGYPIGIIFIIAALFFTATVLIRDRFDARNNSKTGTRTSVRD